MTLSTSLKAELSKRLAAWYEREMGMRPSEVKITSEGEILFIRFKDVLSPSEINLSTQKAGKELIREVNERLCQQAFPRVKEIISELTGLELLDLQVESNLLLHEKLYVLILNRPLQE